MDPRHRKKKENGQRAIKEVRRARSPNSKSESKKIKTKEKGEKRENRYRTFSWIGGGKLEGEEGGAMETREKRGNLGLKKRVGRGGVSGSLDARRRGGGGLWRGELELSLKKWE